MIALAISLASEGQIDAALDVVYDWFDMLFKRDRFEEADRTIQALAVQKLPTDLLIGILTITLAAKHKLLYRSGFFAIAQQELMGRPEWEDGLLNGLA